MPSPQTLRLIQQGLGLLQAGKLDQAAALLQQARAQEPNNYDALHLLGVIALERGRPAEALPLLSLALRSAPRQVPCALRLAQACLQTKRAQQAEQVLLQTLKTDPGVTEVWTHLAIVRSALGHFPDAIQACRKALELQPASADLHDLLGGLVAKSDGYKAAEPHFRKALDLDPADPRPWCNLGICLNHLKQYKEAVACFEKAIQGAPGLAKAHAGLGLAFERLYRLPEAVASLRKAVALDPRDFEARSCLLLNLHYLPDISKEQLFEEHLAFGRALPAPAPRPPATAPQGRALRVGFLSPDFHAHSVAYFIAPLLQGLDHSRFQLFLYHDHASVDWMSEELGKLVQNWRHVAKLPEDALGKLIRADALDLLVDLAGHTAFNRLPLYNRRLAPVQATYLGYPDTTGVPAIDYRLTDAHADPEGSADAFCTETLLRFSSSAWCYTPPPATPEVQPPPCLKSPGTLRFGCFNNFAKITDTSLAAWGRLLASLPGSRLTLKNHGLNTPEMQAAVRVRFAGLGLDPDRVDLLGRTERLQDHLACYHDVDIALDSFPYHGTTTTCEALLMGVPVVTLEGNRHASRVSSSILHTIGHPEWIARDWDEFLCICQGLATNPDALEGLRKILRSKLYNSQICKHSEQSRLFGNALEDMIRKGPR